jgi:hypothetical protein
MHLKLQKKQHFLIKLENTVACHAAYLGAVRENNTSKDKKEPLSTLM